MLAAPVARQYTSKEAQHDADIMSGIATGREAPSQAFGCIPSRLPPA